MKKMWKKNSMLVGAVGIVLLLSSCGTYTGTGAYAGSNIGAILGSAIGGISGGGRGADLGTIVGMAGGAAVGAAIGSSADKKVEQREAQEVHDHYMRVQENKAHGINPFENVDSCNKNSKVQEINLNELTNEEPATVVMGEPADVVNELNNSDDRIEFEP